MNSLRVSRGLFRWRHTLLCVFVYMFSFEMLGAICGGVYLLAGPSFQPFDIDFDPTGKRWIWAICVTFKSSLFINPNTVIILLENRKLKQKLMSDINQELRESGMHESSLTTTKCNKNNKNFPPIFQRKIRNFFDSLRTFSSIAAMSYCFTYTYIFLCHAMVKLNFCKCSRCFCWDKHVFTLPEIHFT